MRWKKVLSEERCKEKFIATKMFKIENYIAPLILSKVEKFVKNIDQQEFQVSCKICVKIDKN